VGADALSDVDCRSMVGVLSVRNGQAKTRRKLISLTTKRFSSLILTNYHAPSSSYLNYLILYLNMVEINAEEGVTYFRGLGHCIDTGILYLCRYL